MNNNRDWKNFCENLTYAENLIQNGIEDSYTNESKLEAVMNLNDIKIELQDFVAKIVAKLEIIEQSYDVSMRD
jgi:hypothetical protein